MEAMNVALVITNDNIIYYENSMEMICPNQSEGLTDSQIIDVYQRYVAEKKHQDEGKVITLNVEEGCIKLAYEPLQEVKPYTIQGEIPVEVYLRFGRRLSLHDWAHLSKQLESGMFGNLYAC